MLRNKIKTSIAETPLLTKVVSLYVLSGLIIWGGSMIPSLIQPETISASNTVPVKVLPSKNKITYQQVIRDYPSRITIPSLNIDLDVLGGVYDSKTGEWSLSDDAVYFATITDLPNNHKGNTFLYGHNRDSALGRMSGIRLGDVVSIETKNGYKFSYEYTHDEIINPDKTTILYDDSPAPRLTIMTCDGLWSEARRLMYFNFVDVQ